MATDKQPKPAVQLPILGAGNAKQPMISVKGKKAKKTSRGK